jgi:hypothetical protein
MLRTRWGIGIAWGMIGLLLIGVLSTCDPPARQKSAQETAAIMAARFEPHRPFCAALYEQELARLDAAARAMPAVAIPLNPTYQELLTVLGPEDARPRSVDLNGAGVAALRVTWRRTLPPSQRAAHSAAVVDDCVMKKGADAFDEQLWRTQTWSLQYPTDVATVEAKYAPGTTIDGQNRPAEIEINHPFSGTLAGLRLGVRLSTFQQQAIALGWQRSTAAASDGAAASNKFRRDHFCLTAFTHQSQVISVLVRDTNYGIATAPAPGSSDSGTFVLPGC